MKQITITYYPVMPNLFRHPIFSSTVDGQFPDTWSEIQPKQLIAIAKLYKQQISDTHFLAEMSGISHRILKRADEFTCYKLMEYLQFIGDMRPFHEFIIPKITIRHPEFISGSLHSPEPKLKGVTFGQFIFADSYFTDYQQSKSEDDLNKFVATLYLPEGELFSEKLINKNHRLIGRKDIHLREAIAINWQLLHEWLALAYPLIFQKREEIKEESHPELVSGSKPNSYSSPWIKIFQNFVGDDILHDEEWANKPINTIFQYMTRKHKENARKKN